MLKRATEAVAAKFRDPKTTYVLETVDESMTEALQPVIIQNRDYDLEDTSQKSNTKSLLCSHFCFEDRKHKSPSVEVISYQIQLFAFTYCIAISWFFQFNLLIFIFMVVSFLRMQIKSK